MTTSPPADATPPAADLRRQRAAARGVTRWREKRSALPGEDAPRQDDVLTSLPRRAVLQPSTATTPPPMRRELRLDASFFATCRRLLVWLRLGLSFGLATAGATLLRRDTPERRARRLRAALERAGGTFLKLGQQMSIRIDLLPLPLCTELLKLLDRVPPFPAEQAIAAVERATGKPLSETFAAFDPLPIGSASVACVYQARLRNGERVAVKVRRPGIVDTFAADQRAMSWIVGVLELLTLVRPELFREMLHDLELMFQAELDFRLEARNTDIFRRRAARSRLRFLSAPRVLFDISSDEVLVTEFVSGIWLWEVLGALESKDPVALAELRRRGIDPPTVGRRLFEVGLFGIYENIIFHADPHPANVVVRRGGDLVLIDFGSCGSYSERQLHILRHFHYCRANDDAGGMTQCALALLEPLPPVDVDAMTREAEEVFGDSIQAVESGGSAWWERTSAGVWIGFLRLARRYHIRVHVDVLRMVRSTLLYDTIALRLDPQLDIYAEYRRYRKRLAKAARKRFRKRFRNLVRHGPDDGLFLRLEELAGVSERLAYQVGRLTDSPIYSYRRLAGKAFFAVGSLLNWTLLAFGLGAAGVVVLAARAMIEGRSPDLDTVGLDTVGFGEIIGAVASSPLYLGAVGLALLFQLRRILVRFKDRENDR